MNQFVLAFPIPVAVDEVFAITENVKVAADAKSVMIPGCSVLFNVVRQPASTDVLDIFKEHCELTEDEEKSLHGFVFHCELDALTRFAGHGLALFRAQRIAEQVIQRGLHGRTDLAGDFNAHHLGGGFISHAGQPRLHKRGNALLVAPLPS